MDQEGIFKTTAFGGFDKKSVLSYIDNLTEKHHALEEELRNQIAEYSKAQDSQVEYIEKLEAQLADAEKKLEAVAGQLEQERAMAPQTTGQFDELTQQNRELEQKLEDAEQERLKLASKYILQAREAIRDDDKKKAVKFYEKALDIYKELDIWDERTEEVYDALDELENGEG